MEQIKWSYILYSVDVLRRIWTELDHLYKHLSLEMVVRNERVGRVESEREREGYTRRALVLTKDPCVKQCLIPPLLFNFSQVLFFYKIIADSII